MLTWSVLVSRGETVYFMQVCGWLGYCGIVQNYGTLNVDTDDLDIQVCVCVCVCACVCVCVYMQNAGEDCKLATSNYVFPLALACMW